MSDERLGSTLFLAALVHGVVILGVTFTVAPAGDGGALPSLNVTLVLDTAREELAHVLEFSYIIVNERFEAALSDLQAVVRASRVTCAQQRVRLAKLIDEFR